MRSRLSASRSLVTPTLALLQYYIDSELVKLVQFDIGSALSKRVVPWRWVNQSQLLCRWVRMVVITLTIRFPPIPLHIVVQGRI